MPNSYRTTLVLIALLTSLSLAVEANSQTDRPRLVVLISVDQLRGDYLQRWQPHFSEDGFNRLINRGAWFENGYYSYGCSATAPGHATLVSGRLPRQHGIVGNKWFLEPGITKGAYAVVDPKTKLVGAGGLALKIGKSPHQLIGSALGDELKLADKRARVFSVSLKDRTAIFAGGQRPDGVFWWDRSNGRFVTSTYYMKKLPDYVQDFNKTKWADRFVGAEWKPLLGPEVYAGCYALEQDWHPAFERYGAAFPHQLPAEPGLLYYTAIYTMPYGNEVVLELAHRIIVNEQLGQDAVPDFLSVGLSSNDPCGHVFGPQSAEVLDITLRTDRQLAGFLNLLDEQIGLDQCLIVLTGDHGVSPAPKVAEALGLRAGLFDTGAAIDGLNETLRPLAPPDAPDPLVLGANQPWIYCDPRFEEADRAVDGALTRAAVKYLRSLDGIADVFTGPELAGPAPSPDDLNRWLAWRSYYPGRSGYFFFKLDPFWYRSTSNFAGHNGAYRSDRHVPIVFTGPRIRPGRYAQQVDTTDIAVTLSAILGIPAPTDAIGRVLHEAMK